MESQAKCTFCGLIRFCTMDLKKHCFSDHKYCIQCEIQYDTHKDLLEHCRQIHKMQIKCDQCPFQGFDWAVKHSQDKTELGQTRKQLYNVILDRATSKKII